MSIRVALHHRTSYAYDRPVGLGPQVVRLRPAPHCRTPIEAYSLKVRPGSHFVNWQQDPFGNHAARFVFPEPATRLEIEVDLVAEMIVVNPFDFFVEESAERFPFAYDETLARDLRPFRETLPAGPRLREFLDRIGRTPRKTVDFLVDLNRTLQETVRYLIRMEPGVQTPEETLTLGSGSCRDSAWLLVQVLRHLGIAARFASGYLIQLAPDVKSLDGPSGTEVDFTDLHAWTEAFVPGAGWIGLDPTSGLLAGEGHVPLACTPDPSSAAPITGGHEPCEVEFDVSMRIERIVETPRVTKPYSEAQWQTIDALGRTVDARLRAGDVRLTTGGEPTFVSIDDMDGAEWNTAAVGPHKRRLSEILLRRLRERYGAGGLLHYGQGKWYPGESLPRWSLGCYWRKDGRPVWRNADLIADPDRDYGFGPDEARRFVQRVAEILDVGPRWIVPAFEDVPHYLLKERRLPIDVDPRDPKLADPEERARLARVFEQGLNRPSGFVLPLRRQWWQGQAGPGWISGPWPVRAQRVFLLPGDSPIGLRLPLDSLPAASLSELLPPMPRDPFAPAGPLPEPARSARRENLERRQEFVAGHAEATGLAGITEQSPTIPHADDALLPDGTLDESAVPPVVRTALCVEPRGGRLYVFLPPTDRIEDYLDLLAAVEQAAEELEMPVVPEGYLPPHDDRIEFVKVTPDPGVIEVNVPPAASWDRLVDLTVGLYEEARQSRLGAEKFDLDGRHTGTGGGNHVVLGGPTAADSPFLRRPDLLRSLLGFWNDHPSLSYLFSGRFVGPTSQSPRVDEGRRDALHELALAFTLVPPPGHPCPPWLVDRIFRNLLVDLTGNTHRAEFCIDKLYSPDSSTGRLGLVELRGFEMPPHPRMSLVQQLLVRGLVARFWEVPYDRPPTEWGTLLHDRFLLPHFVERDLDEVLAELARGGLRFDRAWFAPHVEFRFPWIGEIVRQGIRLELRAAIEPWYVLGEEPGGGGTVRFVDSSVERVQVKVAGLEGDRYVVTCNGRRVPLHATGVAGEAVAGVRYRAWCPPSCLHPTIPVHSPLVFDVLDTWQGRSIGGCTYHVSHPAGRNYASFPVNAFEAESRRHARFFDTGHSPGPRPVPPRETNPTHPTTLDLRRAPSPA